MQNFDTFLGWLAKRLSEPSTWSGLAIILVTMHLNVPSGIMQSVTYIGMGVGGILSFVLTEKGVVHPPVIVAGPAREAVA